jgi:hypothetical protein
MGVTDIKPYHRPERFDNALGFPVEFSDGLYAFAVSLHGARREVYLRQRTSCSWESFVERALAPFGGGEYPFRPHPSNKPDAFGLSVSWTDEQPKAISLYAFSAALPDDASIERQWMDGMNETDRNAYTTALTAARSLGRLRRGKRHGLLAWTLEPGAGWHRAASLNIFPTENQAGISRQES